MASGRCWASQRRRFLASSWEPTVKRRTRRKRRHGRIQLKLVLRPSKSAIEVAAQMLIQIDIRRQPDALIAVFMHPGHGHDGCPKLIGRHQVGIRRLHGHAKAKHGESAPVKIPPVQHIVVRRNQYRFHATRHQHVFKTLGRAVRRPAEISSSLKPYWPATSGPHLANIVQIPRIGAVDRVASSD